MKKPKRVVLGVGHPWFGATGKAGSTYTYDTVYLTRKPVHPSILFRGGEPTVPIKFNKVGNWNKVRLVLEIIK